MTADTSFAGLVGLFFGIVIGWIFCEMYALRIERAKRDADWERQKLVNELYDRIQGELKKE